LITEPGRRWELISYGCAILAAAVLAYALFGLPIQVTDSLNNLIKIQGKTLTQVIVDEFSQQSYLRPLLWGTLKAVFDQADGHYFYVFRGLHALQAAALLLMYVGLVRPRTAADAACVPLGLAVLLGMHTFSGTVREAFPINTFLTILLCGFAAAMIALSEYRRWHDAAAAALLVFASLTVESGLLVAVIFVSAAIAGARGLSRAGVAAQVALVAGYFGLRYLVFDIGTPTLIERASGYGWGTLEPDQLMARFGDNPLPFYAYNIAASVLSVLFSEPRAGVWVTTASLMEDGGRWAAMTISAAASVLATALIGRFVWLRRHAWMTRDLSRDDRLVFISGAVIAANAVLSFVYTKDVIMSPAGAFFAVAVFAAVRHQVTRMPTSRSAAALWVAALMVLSTTWGIRYVGLHADLRRAEVKVRNEWAYVETWLLRQPLEAMGPAAVALKNELREDAVVRHPARPLLPERPWTRIFEVN
jgi:hypothetical protein